MRTIPGQIIGELGELTKTIGSETAKVPSEIAGKALESLGSVKSQKPNVKAVPANSPEAKSREKDSWDSIDGVSGADVRKTVAREALTALLQRSSGKGSSVWEKKQQETESRKRQEAAAREKTEKMKLHTAGAARARGDLYGIKTKRAAAEMSRNVRQD